MVGVGGVADSQLEKVTRPKRQTCLPLSTTNKQTNTSEYKKNTNVNTNKNTNTNKVKIQMKW